MLQPFEAFHLVDDWLRLQVEPDSSGDSQIDVDAMDWDSQENHEEGLPDSSSWLPPTTGADTEEEEDPNAPSQSNICYLPALEDFDDEDVYMAYWEHMPYEQAMAYHDHLLQELRQNGENHGESDDDEDSDGDELVFV